MTSPTLYQLIWMRTVPSDSNCSIPLRVSLCIHGPDRTAELIRYAISDLPFNLLLGQHSTRALPGRETNSVNDILELRCAYVGVTSGGWIQRAGHSSNAVRLVRLRSIEQRGFESVVSAEFVVHKLTQGNLCCCTKPNSVWSICHNLGLLRHPQTN
jgi:hypothetical protein